MVNSIRSISKEKNFLLFLTSLITLLSTIATYAVTGEHGWIMAGVIVFFVTSVAITWHGISQLFNLVGFVWIGILIALIIFVALGGPAPTNVDPSLLPH